MTTSCESFSREEPRDLGKSLGSGDAPPPAVPTQGRLLGLDYGHVRIGVAVSTPEQNIASPLENYTRGSDDADAEFLRKLVDEYRIAGIVVGLPVHMSGDESESSRRAREFGAWVARVTGLPVAYWDERFTSSLAEAHLMSAQLTKKQRAARRDKLAATFLLQSFLDADDRSGTCPPSYRRSDEVS